MLIHDHFQNFKVYQIPRAQLIIADVPYNLGNKAYASNPGWYKDGDNSNGESELAGKSFFDTDKDFHPAEFMHFCSTMLKPEKKTVKVEGEVRQKGDAPCMVLFCAFDQQMYFIELAKRYGLNNYINLVFRKNFSAQVLKANMKIVGNCEYGLVLYRERLPKFRNNGKMIFNCIDWPRDNESEKIHPCLPANEKVYFNGIWKNIQDVEINDKNSYGKVTAKTEHFAEKLIEINIINDKVIATYNHPFLVMRNSRVYWINAENISQNDLILSKVSVYCTHKPIIENTWNTRQQKKDTLDLPKTKKANSDLSILLFGKNIMEKFLWGCRYITEILTRQTITLETCNLSRPLNTSGYTLVADLLMENGKNHVKIAGSIKNAIKKIGIFLVDGLAVNCVKNALLKNQSKSERFLLRRVGSVKTIQKRTKVYNLTIDNVPAFDTLIGVSHNTQKPIKLLETIISIFTDEGDVVIDPVAGSGSTLVAADNLNRKSYGFEIKRDFFKSAENWIRENKCKMDEIKNIGYAKTELEKSYPTLF